MLDPEVLQDHLVRPETEGRLVLLGLLADKDLGGSQVRQALWDPLVNQVHKAPKAHQVFKVKGDNLERPEKGDLWDLLGREEDQGLLVQPGKEAQ